MTTSQLLIHHAPADPAAEAQALLHAGGRPKTWQHVQAVAQKCVEIGREYGVEPERCRMAGLLHDVSAVVPAADMLAYAESEGWEIDPAERAHPFLLHQRLSEVAAQTRFGVTDGAVLAAIRCHTTLRAAPSPCDMALFLADKLAWDQPGEPPFRSVIEDGLSVSLELASLRYIEYVLDHGMILMPHRWLMEALAWLRAHAGSPAADGGAR